MTHYLIAGGTGLIGSALAAQLDNPAIAVTLLSRRQHPLAHPHHKLRITRFDDPELPPSTGPEDTVFCALGTTIRKAGSKAAFRTVDLDMVIALARAAKSAGYERFVVISSLGTDPDTRNFYLQTKAQMEQAVSDVGFQHLTLMRPSLLLGSREEFRIGEKLGEITGHLISPLLRGRWRKYRPIQAETVARAMIRAAQNPEHRLQILESDAIERLAVE